MLPRFRPQVSLRDVGALLGRRAPDPRAVEKEFAAAMGFAHAVYFPQGRTGITAFLDTLPGKGQVVLSPFNCTAIGAAIGAAGHEPYYVDTEADGFAEDPVAFAEAMKTSRVVAGIAVAAWGHRAHEFRTEMPILYDYALGGLESYRPPLHLGQAVLYSTGWGKPLSSYRGGFLCSDDGGAAERWRAWRAAYCRFSPRATDAVKLAALKAGSHPLIFDWARDWGSKTPWAKGLLGKAGVELGDEAYRIPAAGVLETIRRRLRVRHALRTERMEQVRRYSELLRPLQPEGILLPDSHAPLSHYPLRLNDPKSLQHWLLGRGIFTSTDLFSRLLCDFEAFQGECFIEPVRARSLCSRTLHLPLYFGLTENQQERVARAVVQWGMRAFDLDHRWIERMTHAAHRA